MGALYSLPELAMAAAIALYAALGLVLLRITDKRVERAQPSHDRPGVVFVRFSGSSAYGLLYYPELEPDAVSPEVESGPDQNGAEPTAMAEPASTNCFTSGVSARRDTARLVPF